MLCCKIAPTTHRLGRAHCSHALSAYVHPRPPLPPHWWYSRGCSLVHVRHMGVCQLHAHSQACNNMGRLAPNTVRVHAFPQKAAVPYLPGPINCIRLGAPRSAQGSVQGWHMCRSAYEWHVCGSAHINWVCRSVQGWHMCRSAYGCGMYVDQHTSIGCVGGFKDGICAGQRMGVACVWISTHQLGV